MTQKKFSELEAGTVDGTSIFAQTKTEDGSLVSKSASSPSLAGYIGTSHQFAGLNTNAKNLVGAINEAATSGGVVQLTQAEYDLLDPAVQANGSIYKITDNAKMYCLNKAYHPVEECTVAEYNQKSTAQQNDGTIYIQTDAETTGSDIAVSDSDATSIAEAIASIPNLNNISWSYANLNKSAGFTDGGCRFMKIGKLVIVSIYYLVGTSSTQGAVIFSGLPKAANIQRNLIQKFGRNYEPVRVQISETTITVLESKATFSSETAGYGDFIYIAE